MRVSYAVSGNKDIFSHLHRFIEISYLKSVSVSSFQGVLPQRCEKLLYKQLRSVSVYIVLVH